MLYILFLIGFACNENFILRVKDQGPAQGSLEDTGIVDDDPLEPSDTPADPEPESEPTSEPTSEPDSIFEPGDDPEPTNEPDDPPDAPGQTANNPKLPEIGEILVNELMIDPTSVPDKNGEWLELYNTSGDWIDLTGLSIMDLNKDNYVVQSVSANSLIIPPNGYITICASTTFLNNGGIDCQGSFYYNCFGSGFCLANSEDEVILVSSTYIVLDTFYYSSGFASTGASMGVTPSSASYSGNDDESKWCDQWGFLPHGGYGSPGSMNDICF